MLRAHRSSLAAEYAILAAAAKLTAKDSALLSPQGVITGKVMLEWKGDSKVQFSDPQT